MDVNLTHAIAANVTLLQPLSHNSDTFNAFLSGAFVTLVVTIIGAIANYKIAQKNIKASVENTDKTITATLESINKTMATSLEITNETIKQEKFKMQEEERQEKHGKRQEAYSLLMGRKHTMLQFYASYYSMFIRSGSFLCHGKILAFSNIDIECDELKLVIEHRRKGSLIQKELDQANRHIQEEFASEVDKSPDVKEGLRTRQRWEDLQLEVGRTAERVFEILGKIKILFPSQEVRDLVEQIEKSLEDLANFEIQINEKTEIFNQELQKAIDSTTSVEPDSINSNKKIRGWTASKDSELHDWVFKMFAELKIRIERELDPKIEKLLEHIEAEIKLRASTPP